MPTCLAMYIVYSTMYIPICMYISGYIQEWAGWGHLSPLPVPHPTPRIQTVWEQFWLILYYYWHLETNHNFTAAATQTDNNLEYCRQIMVEKSCLDRGLFINYTCHLNLQGGGRMLSDPPVRCPPKTFFILLQVTCSPLYNVHPNSDQEGLYVSFAWKKLAFENAYFLCEHVQAYPAIPSSFLDIVLTRPGQILEYKTR